MMGKPKHNLENIWIKPKSGSPPSDHERVRVLQYIGIFP